jgi:hypothetical protein
MLGPLERGSLAHLIHPPPETLGTVIINRMETVEKLRHNIHVMQIFSNFVIPRAPKIIRKFTAPPPPPGLPVVE